MTLTAYERVVRYKIKHLEKFYDMCSICNGMKSILAKKCDSCDKKRPSGRLSPFFKGGYENHKAHNRLSAERRKTLRGSHTDKEWEKLKKKFGYMCLCCKQVEPTIKLQKDHIIPISKRGSTNYITNIQPLCGVCNSRKYNKIINFIELHENFYKAGTNL